MENKKFEHMNRLGFIAIIVLAALASSCKTNEANYKAAYEKAKEKQTSEKYDDPALAAMKDRTMPKMRVIDGDSLLVRVERVSISKDGGNTDGKLLRFNVVVGEFHQLFNANSMCERLMKDGYPKAFLLKSADAHYFVVCDEAATAGDAKKIINKVKNDSKMTLKSPYPYVLIPSHLNY